VTLCAAKIGNAAAQTAAATVSERVIRYLL
jgi:hypothetical protein